MEILHKEQKQLFLSNTNLLPTKRLYLILRKAVFWGDLEFLLIKPPELRVSVLK